MPDLELFLFGPPRLRRGEQVVELTRRKGAALLAYLLLTNQPHSRDALASLFWPESDQSGARASLRRTLYRLNQEVGEEILLATSETIERNPQAEVWLDVEAFRQQITGCLEEEEAGAQVTAGCLQRLAKAAELYGDDFMAGFSLPDSPDFDEWQFFQREALRRSLARVLVRLVEAHGEEGAWETAIDYARRHVALDPLHEPAHRQLMRLYARAGQQAAALRQYELCKQRLEEELGVAPDAETEELYEAIRTRRFPAADAGAAGSPGEALTLPQTPVQTRYVQSGEVHIAYQVLGQGPPDVVFVGGFVSHLEHMWQEPRLARFWQRLASSCRLILFDKRGVGLSDRVGYAPTLEHTMDDILSVMDVVGVERAVLFGVSEGGPNSALFAATYPHRVSGLILYGTVAKFTRAPHYPWALTREQWSRWLKYLLDNWGTAVSVEGFAPTLAGDDDFRQWWAQMLRLSSSPGAVQAVLEVAQDIDVRHVLPAIGVPTLVLHREDDIMMRVEGGRYLAEQIPTAKYVELPGADHWWWVGDAGGLLNEIESFLAEVERSAVPDRVLATILMAGVVDGEGAAGEAFGQLLQREAARFRGREVVAGNGERPALSFDGPSRALHCARALRDHARREGMDLQIGLHTGECDRSDSRLSGIPVQVAARLQKKAAPGQILLSNTVKDLVAGSGLDFLEEGTFRIPEADQSWRLFSLA